MISLQRQDWLTMAVSVARQSPLEACGLVAGVNGTSARIYEIENDLASPTRFALNPRQQVVAMSEMEANGWDLLAIYHSHPKGPAHPSMTDLAEAHYPGVVHLVWAPADEQWQCRAFLLDDGQISAVEYRRLGE